MLMVLSVRLYQSYFSFGTLFTSSKDTITNSRESRLSQPCQFAGVQMISAKVS